MKKRFRQEKLFCKKRRTSEAMAIPTLPRTPKGQDKVTRPELSNRPKNDHVRTKSSFMFALILIIYTHSRTCKTAIARISNRGLWQLIDKDSIRASLHFDGNFVSTAVTTFRKTHFSCTDVSFYLRMTAYHKARNAGATMYSRWTFFLFPL